MAVKQEKERLYLRKHFINYGANVYATAKIGNFVKAGYASEIGNAVKIGDNVSIGKGSFLCEGVEIGNDVFIGPHVCFTNDKYPPSKKSNWKKTIVRDGAKIGAAVTILPGVTIGENALIGAGSVVTKNVDANTAVYGNPAKIIQKGEDNGDNSGHNGKPL